MDVYTQEQIDYINDSMKRIPDSAWLFKRLPEMRIHESVVLFDDNTAMAARPHEIITNDWNHFKDWKCSVGLEAPAVYASGELLGSCQLKIFGDNVPNIFSEEFDLVSAPEQIVCSRDCCGCQPDTHVTKSLL